MAPASEPDLRIAPAMTTCASGRFLQPQLDSIVDQHRTQSLGERDAGQAAQPLARPLTLIPLGECVL